MEVPCPALVAANLHTVVWCVPCPVTCAWCWAALCAGDSNPVRCPPRHQEDRMPVGPRVVHAFAEATCSTSSAGRQSSRSTSQFAR